MNTLKLEVVRFNSEDVIATSLIANQYYMAKRSEAIEGNLSNLSYDYPDVGGSWIRFWNDISGSKDIDYVVNDPSSWSFGDISYAWYDNDAWTSEEKAWSSYGGVFPE